MLKNGSERVVGSARDHLFEIRALESYKYTDDRGRDQGLNVRHRAKLLVDLIQDDEQLRIERRKAKTEGKEKYQGFSKEDMRIRGGAISFSSNKSSYDSWEKSSADRSERRNSFGDDREAYQDREVNSFQFPEEGIRNARDSPELGIREKTPELSGEEEDEFGDFAQARTSALKKSEASDPVPSIPPPSSAPLKISIPVSQIKTTNAAKETTLFDLSGDPFSGSQPAVNSINNKSTATALSDDLFSLNFTPSSGQTLPANLLDTVRIETKSNDNFNQTNVQMSSGVSQTPLVPPNLQQSFISTLSPGVADFAGVSPSNVPKIEIRNSLTAIPSFATPRTSPSDANARNAQMEIRKEPEFKLPSTWSDASTKVNISLDNLGIMRSPVKQSIPMSQMVSSQSAHSSLNRLKQSTSGVTSAQSLQGFPVSQSFAMSPQAFSLSAVDAQTSPQQKAAGAMGDLSDLFI